VGMGMGVVLATGEATAPGRSLVWRGLPRVEVVCVVAFGGRGHFGRLCRDRVRLPPPPVEAHVEMVQQGGVSSGDEAAELGQVGLDAPPQRVRCRGVVKRLRDWLARRRGHDARRALDLLLSPTSA